MSALGPCRYRWPLPGEDAGCESCGEPATVLDPDWDDEPRCAKHTEAAREAEYQRTLAHWRPLWRGEQQAGLVGQREAP